MLETNVVCVEKKEGSQLTTICSQLKMLAPDGKIRLSDAMNTKNIFRLIESVPSPKAEPMKLWLANLGKERIDEVKEVYNERKKIRNNFKFI